MITKVEKLSEPLMKSIFDGSITLKEYNKNKGAIHARCDYIVRKIMEIQEVTDWTWWDFNNGSEIENCRGEIEKGSDGYFNPDQYAQNVEFNCRFRFFGDNLNFSLLPYHNTFPTRWIWMDFEEECQQEYQKIVRQWEKSKSGIKAKKEEKEKIKKEALQKLTPEERKVLGY